MSRMHPKSSLQPGAIWKAVNKRVPLDSVPDISPSVGASQTVGLTRYMLHQNGTSPVQDDQGVDLKEPVRLYAISPFIRRHELNLP